MNKKLLAGIVCCAIGVHILVFWLAAGEPYARPGSKLEWQPITHELFHADHSWLQAFLLGLDFLAIGIGLLTYEDNKK